MTAAGVEFVTAARTEPYGRVAVFADIAGNRWDLLGPAPQVEFEFPRNIPLHSGNRDASHYVQDACDVT